MNQQPTTLFQAMPEGKRDPIQITMSLAVDPVNALKCMLSFICLLGGIFVAKTFVDIERALWAKHIFGDARQVEGTPCIFGVEWEPSTENLRTVTIIAPLKDDIPHIPVTFLQRWHFTERLWSGAICAPNTTTMFYIYDGAASVSMKDLQLHNAPSQNVWMGIGAMVGLLLPLVMCCVCNLGFMFVDAVFD